MRNIRRFLLFFLTVLFIGTLFAYALPVSADTGVTYEIVETAEENELDYDINHFRDIAKTNDNGTIRNQQVNVLEIPNTSNARIISFANLKNHKWTLTTVRNLALQFEEENPDWKVIAAVNADFFDIGANGNLPYQTNNAVVTEGEYYKTTTNGTLGFANDGSINPLIAVKKPTRSQFMVLSVYDENDNIIKEFDIHTLNASPGMNQTSVYFGTYDTSHTFHGVAMNFGSASGFVVGNAELALPNRDNDFYGKGIISSTSPSTLGQGQFAIVTNNTAVKDALAVGVKIRAQYEFSGEMARATSVTGFDGHFLVNGEYQLTTRTDLTVRHPRTTVGVRPDGTIVMAVIDGRQIGKGMEGVRDTELAAIMSEYGCIDAYNLDGGGSSTMMIRKNGEFVVVNSPSDGAERRDSNAILIAVKMPNIVYTYDLTQDSISFEATLLAENGHDISSLYIELNGVQKPIDGSAVLFTELDRNTSYYYRFLYKDSNGAMNPIMVDGQIRTLKQRLLLLGLEIKENDTVFDIKILYEDPDDCSLIQKAEVFINGTKVICTNGTALFPKVTVGDTIESIEVRYRYDLNEGQTLQIVNNVPYLLVSSAACNSIESMIQQAKAIIEDIYR